jgi:hypothetical protein
MPPLFAVSPPQRLQKRRRRITLGFINFMLFNLLNASCMPAFPPPGKLTPLKLDEPKDAALTFVRAIGSGDPETAKAASIGTNQDKHWVIATANMVNGLRAFDTAMLDHFGPPAASIHMSILNGLNSLTVDPEDAVNNAVVKFSADQPTAVLIGVSPIFASHMFYASRVRKDAQGWKVDLPAILAADPQFKAKNDSPDLDRLAEIGDAMRGLAKDIKAGKYATVEEAETAASQISPE